ncbi:MAG: class A sortase [Enterococcus italicus]|uniref:class A sortase n=1 Tax=Enterococcus italicus TaxID=246144 RepID=UPI002597F7E1|nr:class A sortase [Enterococcus italicus]
MKLGRIKNWLVNLVLLLLLLIGLALVFNNQIRSFFMAQRTAQYELTNVSQATIEKNEKKEASFDFDAVQPISTQAVLEAQLSNKALPVIGGVAIPSVSINLPIFKGVSNEALLYGAGTFSPSQQMGEGNYALASHRTDRQDLLFTSLDQVETGAVVYLTDLKTIYTYRVYRKARIQPTQVEVLDDVPNKKIVTLITCGELTGETRIVVQGELEATTAIADATKDMLAAFEMAQKTY